MKDKLKFDFILTVYIFINMIFVLVGSCLSFNNIILMQEYSYGFIVLLVINIVLILLLMIRKKYKKNIIDIFLILIIIFAIISTIFSYNVNKSIFGRFNRYEGLFTILYYMTILFLTSFMTSKNKKRVVYFILTIGIIEAFYSIFQKFGLFNVKTSFYKGERLSTGFTINPNFLGTLMVICAGYSIGLFFNEKGRFKEILYLVITCILFFSLLLTNTLSCFLALLIIMILLLIYGIKYKYLKKYFILSLLLTSIFIISHKFNITKIASDVLRTKTETVSIIQGDLNNDYGSGRIELWKKTIPIIPKYLLHGVGVDCFSNVIDGKMIWRIKDDGYRTFYDKAHNEYLQILVTMGIFSLISYLCLHFIIIKNGIKKMVKTKEIYCLLPVIGYLIQAQFNISVIEVAPIFYIGLGLIVNRNN